MYDKHYKGSAIKYILNSMEEYDYEVGFTYTVNGSTYIKFAIKNMDKFCEDMDLEIETNKYNLW